MCACFVLFVVVVVLFVVVVIVVLFLEDADNFVVTINDMVDCCVALPFLIEIGCALTRLNL